MRKLLFLFCWLWTGSAFAAEPLVQSLHGFNSACPNFASTSIPSASTVYDFNANLGGLGFSGTHTVTTANVFPGPDCRATALKVVEDTATNNHQSNSSTGTINIAAGARVTMRYIWKSINPAGTQAGETTALQVSFRGNTTTHGLIGRVTNACNVSPASPTATWTAGIVTTQRLAGGWCYVTVSGTASAESQTFQRSITLFRPTQTTNSSYTGDGQSGVLIWMFSVQTDGSTTQNNILVPPTGDPFYYMASATSSPAGNDSNSGLDAAHPWLTLNHTSTFNCGDIVFADAGAYVNNYNNTAPAVANCPSTTGGIDSTGGIYGVLVICNKGLDVTSCPINSVAVGSWGIQVLNSNWFFYGFDVVSSVSGSILATCTSGFPCTGTHATIGYVAFLNCIAQNGQQGIAITDSGSAAGSTGHGIDEAAVVGCIAYNTSQDNLPVSGIDFAGEAPLDALAGTHVFAAGNFAWHNWTAGTLTSDEQGLIFDTFDQHNYPSPAVMLSNIAFYNGGVGMAIFQQNNGTATGLNTLQYNTTYADFQQALSTNFTAGAVGEYNFQVAGGGPAIIANAYNNLAQTTAVTAPCGGCTPPTHTLYAMLQGGNYTMNIGGAAGLQNVLGGLATVCTFGSCDPGHNVITFGTFAGNYSTNFYANPAYKNTTDLITNRTGPPSCAGFATTTECMGYSTSTGMTSPSTIDDLTPTNTNAIGKGYQVPGPCVTTGPFHDLFPTWLKGVVGKITVSGTVVTVSPGLVTKPCGM